MSKTTELESGSILVAAAHMADSNFSRTVVLMCEHQDQGSFGLILNQPTQLRVSELVESVNWDSPVYHGGPVQENSLHFIHSRRDVDVGSREIVPGVFWGGDFDELSKLLNCGIVAPEECRFFVGYSGWGAGQLREEVLTDSWYIFRATSSLVFHDDAANHWRDTLKAMGPDYKILSNFPDDPRLN